MRDLEREFQVLEHYRNLPPVDVRAAIFELGVGYEERELGDGNSGRIDFDGRTYKITVNSSEGPQRQRFTAAHELGHYHLHRDLLDIGGHLDRLFDAARAENATSPFRPWHEIQANRFAADFLMAPRLVREAWDEYESVAELADKFAVSRSAMRIRLQSLGVTPEPELF